MDNAGSIFLDHVGWLHFPPDDDVLQFLREGWFEYTERSFLLAYLQPGDTYLDIGAHAGTHCAVAASVLGSSGKIIAVEPNHDLHPFIDANVASTACPIRILPYAVAGTAGTLHLQRGASGKAAYAYLGTQSATGSISVEVITLSDLIAAETEHAAAVIKIDIEGAEFEVIESSQDLLLSLDSVILLEFSEQNLNRSGSTTEQLERAVKAAGLSLCKYDARTNSVREEQPNHPVWYENYVICRDYEAVNQRLASSSREQLTNSLDVFEKGIAAFRIYDAAESARAMIPRLQKLATKLPHVEQILTGKDQPPLQPQASQSEIMDLMEQHLGALESISLLVASEINELRISMVALSEEHSSENRKLETRLEESGREIEESRQQFEALRQELEDTRRKMSEDLEKLRSRLSEATQELQTTKARHAEQLSRSMNQIYAIQRLAAYRASRTLKMRLAGEIERLLEMLS